MKSKDVKNKSFNKKQVTIVISNNQLIPDN